MIASSPFKKLTCCLLLLVVVVGLQTLSTADAHHIKDWKQKWYSYHGECDLVLIKVPKLDLDIHIRTTIQNDESSLSSSHISSAALRIGEDILQVDNDGGYHVNGVPNPPNLNLLTLSGHNITYTQNSVAKNSEKESRESLFRVNLLPEGLGEEDGGLDDNDDRSSSSDSITIQVFQERVSVQVDDTSDDFLLFEDSVGLLGSFTTGEHVARDGHTIITDPISFGQEWQVNTNIEPKLFVSTRSPQYPKEVCRFPTTTTTALEKARRGLLRHHRTLRLEDDDHSSSVQAKRCDRGPSLYLPLVG